MNLDNKPDDPNKHRFSLNHSRLGGNVFLLVQIFKHMNPQKLINIVSTVCWELRRIVREEMNFYWHYQYLKLNDSLPIKVLYHKIPGGNDDGIPKKFKVYCLTNKQKIRLDYPVDYYSHIGNKNITPEDKKKLKIYSRFTFTNTFITDPFIFLNKRVRTACIHRISCMDHWVEIFYPYGDQMYQKDYNPRVNYFFNFIDNHYHQIKHKAVETINSIQIEKERDLQQVDNLERQILLIKNKQSKHDQRIKLYQSVLDRFSLENVQDKKPDGFIYFIKCKEEYKSEDALTENWKNLSPEEQNKYQVLAELEQERNLHTLNNFLQNRI